MHAAPKAANAWLSDCCGGCPLGDGRSQSPNRPALHRLQTRPQFQAALAGGTVARTPHFALHGLPLMPQFALSDAPIQQQGPGADPDQALFALPGVWIGAMVPKRWARRAVTRNAIKRQIYNVSQQFESRLAGAAYVVRLRAAFDRQQFISASSERLKLAVREELLQLFERGVRA